MTNSGGGTPNGPGPQQGGAPQQSGYGQQGGYPPQNGYGQQNGYPQQNGGQPSYPTYGTPYPQAPGTNVLAIVTLVAAFVVPLVGVITGHIALNQLKTSGEQGEGLAKAGLIISYVYCGIVAVVLVISIVAPMLIFAAFIPFWESGVTSP